MQPSFSAFREAVDREVFEPGSGLLRPMSKALRRLRLMINRHTAGPRPVGTRFTARIFPFSPALGDTHADDPNPS